MSTTAEQRAVEFEELRPLLFSIAYRILSSVSDAEDVVQDAWLTFEQEPQVRSAKAFLSTVVTRTAINTLKSARVRREAYVGDWMPEPLLEDPYQDPQRSAELADSLSMAALLLLERLSPLERAAYVLREVFAYDYAEIATLLEREDAACRQLVARARRHMQTARTRFTADRSQREELAEHFFDALRAGDVDGLRRLLTDDAQLTGDSGGRAPNLPHVVAGADNVSRVAATALTDVAEAGGTLDVVTINGQPGGLLRDRDGRIVTVIALDIIGGGVQTVRAITNPEKLAHLGEVTPTQSFAHELKSARRRRRGEEQS